MRRATAIVTGLALVALVALASAAPPAGAASPDKEAKQACRAKRDLSLWYAGGMYDTETTAEVSIRQLRSAARNTRNKKVADAAVRLRKAWGPYLHNVGKISADQRVATVERDLIRSINALGAECNDLGIDAGLSLDVPPSFMLSTATSDPLAQQGDLQAFVRKYTELTESPLAAVRHAKVAWARVLNDGTFLTIGWIPDFGTSQGPDKEEVDQEMIMRALPAAAAAVGAQPQIQQVHIVLLGCAFLESQKTLKIYNRQALATTSFSSSWLIETLFSGDNNANDLLAQSAAVIGAGTQYQSPC